MVPMVARPLRAVLLAALAASLLSPLGWAQEGPAITAVRADPATVDEGDLVAFEVDAHHPASAPMRFGWDFGDGTALAPDPSARRTFAAYRDDGEFEVTVTVEDASGRVDVDTLRVTVRNVAPVVRGIDRDGESLERSELTFRARASDPGDDRLTYRWDFGDGTVLGPSEELEVARHAYEREGSYALTLTVDDGDGGTATYTETIVVGAGFRFSASGAVAADGDGESPYLMGVPVVWDGERTRFAGDLGALMRGLPAAAEGASCFVSFGSRVVTLASGFQEGPVVRFTGVFPSGLAEGSYPVGVVRNELPFSIYDALEREWSQPNTFFAHLGTMRIEGDAPVGTEFHGAGGSVELRRWQDGRIELTFSANLEETLGPLDLLDVPGPLQLRPALLAQVRGSFAHAPKRSMLSGEGSLNPLAGAGYGDWYLCAPRDPLLVEEVVPDPELASAAGAARDVPLIDFEDPEVTVRFSRPVDIGSAVENVVLEWRRVDGNFEEVPILVMGIGDDTLRLAPLDDLMDGVVYRARVVGGLNGVQGRDGEALAEDETWLFETLLDLSEERNGVTLATTQVARDAPLVANKPTETRVYLNWREKPQVHPEWQTRYATFLVEVAGGDYEPKRVRVKRPDLYGPVDRKYALDSVNFHGWAPGGGGSHTLTARVVQAGQVGPERAFEGAWTVDGYGTAPALTFDYHFLRVGSWAEGVPGDARLLGHRIARLGAVFTEQTFPVPSVIARYRGDVVIDEPDGPIVELMGQEFFLSSLATASRRDEVLVDAYAERLGATDADVVIAFLPPDVLRLSGFAYGALGHDPRVVAIQVDTMLAEAIDYYPSTVAHEIGHTYGLAHGSDCPRGSLQTCVDLGRSDGIEGTRIAQGGASGWNKSRWGGNAEVGGTPGSVFSLMHPENLPDVVAFITNEDYARLQDTFRSLAARPADDAWAAAIAASLRGGGALHVQEARVPGLQVAGAIDVATGRAVLLSVVPVVRAGVPPAAAGAAAAAADVARLEARAANGELLARVAIDAEPADAWHAPEAPAALRPFAAFLPAGADVTSLAVLDGDRLLIEWRVSAEAPELELPDGPLDATSDVRLTWTASDPDGDPLRFDVDYAPDGRDWRPLAIGLRAASLRLSPEALQSGPEPRIRVVARDGLRATAAEIAVVLDGAPRLAATAPAEGETAPAATAVTVWTVGGLGEVGPDALTLLREDAPEGEPVRVPGRLSRLPAGDGLRFVPDAPLAADASYRATFGAGVVAADGAPFDGALSWSFRTGPAAPERTFQERNLSGRPLGSAAGDDAEAAATTGTELPGTCAGLERDAFAPLLPAGASLVEALEADGACRLVVTSGAAPVEVRAFVERAVLTNRLFLTANRAEGDAVRIGARGAAFTAEAVIEPGPPTRLTWTLRPAE
jgi:PKD repeat protein